jgi:uncharacterized protein DUF5666
MTKLILVLSLCSLSAAQVAMSGVQPASESAALEKEGAAVATQNPQELLPELPPVPSGDPTLIGGSIVTLDQVRNQIVLRVFGGDDMKVLFDERTTITRGGTKGSFRDLRAGEHVYLDTVLDGKNVFARGIRIQSGGASGEGHGQIMAFDRSKNELVLRDQLSPEPVRLQLTSSTKILNINKQAASTSDLRTGALVTVRFQPDGNGSGKAQEVSILALPGTAFTFTGRVTFLDMHSGLLVLEDPRDRKAYEINFDPSRVRLSRDVTVGSDVSVTADFDGTRYTATTITGTSPSATTQPAQSNTLQR